MNYGELLLSKVIDTNDVAALKRFDISAEHFATETERQAYRYILDYAERNRGDAPSYATVVGEIDEFTYIPSVSDSYEWLTTQLKNNAAKRMLRDTIEREFAEQFATESDGNKLLDILTNEVEKIKIRTSVRKSIGKTLEQLKDDFADEYERRKEGKSFKLWLTPFDSLNKEIGGLYSGDIYGIMGESGRGKSYLIIALVDSLLRQGAKVFVKSFELKSYIFLSRLFSIMTAVDEILTDDQGRKVGIPNKELLTGKLREDYEKYFLTLLQSINEYYPGELILQAKGDEYLTRSIDELDRELYSRPDIDVVVIDPIYGFSDVYGRNSNKTTGGAAEQAARKFEHVIGKHDVVGIYAVQATVDKKTQDEDGNRELSLPTRDKVKTSKALLEIATNLFSFDSIDGLAMLGVEKGRNGAEDFRLELLALLDYGVLREMPSGEVAAQQFTEIF